LKSHTFQKMFVTFSDEPRVLPQLKDQVSTQANNKLNMDGKQVSTRSTTLLSPHSRHNGTYAAQLNAEFDHISVASLNFADENKMRKPSMQIVEHSTSTPPNAQRRATARKHWQQHTNVPYVIGADVDETSGGGLCEKILHFFSWVLLAMFLPFSLFLTLKVVQEYE
jgi:hypothetical protein